LTAFQFVTLPLLLVMALATAMQMMRHRLTPRVGATWLFLWVASATAIAFPELLVQLAHILGIGRGADLVLYLSILFSFAAFFAMYLRFRKVDEQLTKIIRHLAIRDAATGKNVPEDSSAP
jgi:small membrane protein